ncbi:MAG: hypothetical protein JSV25_10110 [Spirochaetota bacterium]|nr:MAG: hypothetical protein JSV25_10110 [Spirochaetota bacterium]
MKLKQGGYLKKLLFYSVIGMLLGYLILHPISMVIHYHHLQLYTSSLNIFRLSFSRSHLLMALYFTLLGAAFGIIQGFISLKILKKTKRIQILEDILPICASCKRIRVNDDNKDENEKWIPVESYFSEQSKVDFTHGICPDCMKKDYPDYIKNRG